MATKTAQSGSQIKLSKAASQKLVGILKKPQTKAQKESSVRAKGTYTQYREKWLQS